jgi:DNA-binding CsgD family transcriptional regulator
MIFIIDPANRAGIPVAWIMDAYRLTQAEARVAIAISTGSTIPKTAAQLGLSPNTVKTHLRHVFAGVIELHEPQQIFRLAPVAAVADDIGASLLRIADPGGGC